MMLMSWCPTWALHVSSTHKATPPCTAHYVSCSCADRMIFIAVSLRVVSCCDHDHESRAWLLHGMQVSAAAHQVAQVSCSSCFPPFSSVMPAHILADCAYCMPCFPALSPADGQQGRLPPAHFGSLPGVSEGRGCVWARLCTDQGSACREVGCFSGAESFQGCIELGPAGCMHMGMGHTWHVGEDPVLSGG
jgi:hypothetical protein